MISYINKEHAIVFVWVPIEVHKGPHLDKMICCSHMTVIQYDFVYSYFFNGQKCNSSLSCYHKTYNICETQIKDNSNRQYETLHFIIIE